MITTLRVVSAQLNFLVGDIEGNAAKIISAIQHARDQQHADIIVFPELALTGYPPEDLLLRPALYLRIAQALNQIKARAQGIDVILGYPEKIASEGDPLSAYNQLSLLRDGQLICSYHKQELPNYSVFDEMRYFKAGNRACIIESKGIPIALSICEDLWFPKVMAQAKAAGARLMLCANASPFDAKKDERRLAVMSQRAREGNMPLVYVNLVGGQDELVFDGGSIVFAANGEVRAHAAFFKEEMLCTDFEYERSTRELHVLPQTLTPQTPTLQRIYEALVFGVKEYIEKNGFKTAIIGLSGGIDSALTLAIAVDAIGHERVEAVMMPSRFTSQMSLDDARQQAETLKVHYRVLSIEPAFQAFLATLADEFAGLPPDSTEENLQARCRGVLLMALSNKSGGIVLTTGNKSELSVGYATLYGDMAGGFCALKDIPKTLVYQLAHYRNSRQPVIPQRVIERPPSAELAPGQTDQDLLPPYDILDQILERYIEKEQSVETIIAAGFDPATVKRVARLVLKNEYKRRQAAPGVRISERAFGRDRRYPITCGYDRAI